MAGEACWTIYLDLYLNTQIVCVTKNFQPNPTHTGDKNYGDND